MRLRALLLACLLALVVTGSASAANDFTGHRHQQTYRVVIVRGLGTGDLWWLAQRGAVGLLVPNAGPRTSAADALVGMVRGILYNARLPRPRRDSVLITFEKANAAPMHGPAIVIGLPPQRQVSNDRRYPIAVIGPGWHGVLQSKLTRVPGLVSMADVARTALQTPRALQSRPAAYPAATLDRLESQIRVARSSTLPGSVLVLALLAAFALLFPRGAPGALGAALAANLALGWIPAGPVVPRLALLGLSAVAGGLLAGRLTPDGATLGLLLTGVVGAYAIAMAVHPWALSLAPLGPELTSRFYGVSNLLEALLLGPALLGAALLGARFGGLAFGAVGLLALATIAENRLGDDGGGALVVGAAFAVLAAGLIGRRWRLLLPAVGLATAAVLALIGYDAASTRSDHLSGAFDRGLHGLGQVAANRVPLSYDRMLEQWYLVFPTLGAVVVALAVFREARTRREAAVAVALGAAVGVSLLVNDSPGAVTLAGLTAMLSVEGGAAQRLLVLPLARRVGVSVGTTVGPPRPQE